MANIPGPNGPGYKAGRPAKPHWLPQIKERLVKQWGAQEIIGYEADDALGIYQTKDTVAVHIDKDINMIPGWHYNHVKGEWLHVPDGIGSLTYADKKLKGKGLMFFYAQMLMGDRTDNIPGIPGIGDKGAFTRLAHLTTEEECATVIASEYGTRYQEHWEEAIAEVADLLWIVRSCRNTGSQYLRLRGLL